MSEIDRTDATEQEFQARFTPFEEGAAAVASYLPYIAFEGEFGNGQIAHRAVKVGDEFHTGCGLSFRDEEAAWATWGVSGPMEPGEWPEITCPRCPQPPTVVVDYGDRDAVPTPPEVREAALREQVIEAMSWAETFDDGRIGQEGATDLLDKYLTAYRATQDGGAEEAPPLGAPDESARVARAQADQTPEDIGWPW